MFGDPAPVTQKQRSAAYVTMWLGALGSLLLLASHIGGWPIGKLGPVMGIAAGGMLSVAWNYRMDDYFRSLCAKGQQFLTFFMGVYLFVLWVDITLHDDGKANGAFTAWMADGYMAAICGCVAFYAGYAYAFIRDRF
ncbi:MAG: hypothetical protein ACKOPE_14095 [Novosphingobium sp.]